MKKMQSLAGERNDPLEQRIKIYYCMELFQSCMQYISLILSLLNLVHKIISLIFEQSITL